MRKPVGLFFVPAIVLCGMLRAELPAEYTRLPYLRPQGRCQVKTVYTPLVTDRIEMIFSPTQTALNECLWCARGGGGAKTAFTAIQYKDYSSKNPRIYFLFNNSTVRSDHDVNNDKFEFRSDNPFVIGEKYRIVADGNARTCTITDLYTGAETAAFSWTISDDFTVGSQIALFATHINGTSTAPTDNFSSHAFYSFKVYDKEGTLKVDLVPVKRTADGVVGLYDVAREIFLVNTSGLTGSLSAEPMDKRFIQNATLDTDEVFGTVTVEKGVSLGLGGNRLTTSALAGYGTITNSNLPDLTSPDPDGVRVTSVPAIFPGFEEYSAKALFNNNFVRHENPDHRLIVKESTLPLKIDYDFGEEQPTIVNAYKIYYDCYVNLRAPKAWRFYGSNTKEEEDWTLLDERMNETDWNEKETRTYHFPNNTAYRYYRIEFLEKVDAVGTDFQYLELIQLEYLFVGDKIGEVCLDVPAQTVVTNATVGLHGDLRLVKKGAGCFVSDKFDQTYTCGTWLTEGTIDAAHAASINSSDYRNTPFGCWSKVDVFSRLAPFGLTHRAFNFKNGSVLDLAGCAAAFDGEKFTFDEDAAVTVDLSGRTPTEGERILAWGRRPANVEFSFDATTAAGGITPVQTDSGLFYGSSDTVAEVALWTGAAGNGDAKNAGNWICRNASGEVIEGGIPSTSTIIYLSGGADGKLSMTVPEDETFSAVRCVVSNAVLTADYDLRACGTLEIADGCTLDLNGHKLFASRIAGSGTITDSIASLGSDLTSRDSNGDRVTSIPATFPGFESYSAKTLFNNNIYWGQNNRLIVKDETLPIKIDYDFGVEEPKTKIVNAYKVWFSSYTKYRAPKAWKFYGSNTKADDDWTVLDERTNETDWLEGTEARTYHFLNTTPYRYYRIEFLKKVDAPSNNDYKYLELIQLEYFHFTELPGELHIDVPAGEIARNKTVALTGNLKLVKEGEGTFVATKPEQTYLGGTDVRRGAVALFDWNWQRLLGPQYATIEVQQNATVYLNTQVHIYDIICSGGTLANSFADLPYGYAGLAFLTLTADSTLDMPYSSSILRDYYNPTKVDLGGHTLNLVIERNFEFANCDIMNGLMSVVSHTGGGTLTFNENHPSRASTANFDLSCKIKAKSSVTMRDLVLRAPCKTVAGASATISVVGRFKTETTDFPNVRLENGAELDLSGMTDTLAVESSANGYSLAFADNAEIRISLGDRTVTGRNRIVSWNTPPANLDGLVFKCAEGERFSVRKAEDGLYVWRGLSIHIR